MDIYKFAAQNALRFPSVRGDLVVEQLFSLPLTSKNGFDLDAVAKFVNALLKTCTEESFVASHTNPMQRPLEVALDVVKDVIATRQEANAAALARAERVEQRRKILDAISNKKDQQLSEATIDELEKKLAALDA